MNHEEALLLVTKIHARGSISTLEANALKTSGIAPSTFNRFLSKEDYSMNLSATTLDAIITSCRKALIEEQVHERS